MDAKDWIKEGSDWFDKGDYQKAIECYEKWSDTLTSGSSDTLALDIILANINQILQIYPNNAEAWHVKGNVYIELKNYLASIECFDKAIGLDSKYVAAYSDKGVILDILKKYEDALKCFNKAIELEPNNATIYNLKGNTLYSLDKYDEAIKCYDKAIKLDPKDASAYNNKGIILYGLGKYQEAAHYFNRAKIDIFDILSICGESAKYMLDDNNFFKRTIGNISDVKEIDNYKDVYLCSLKILQVLQIKEDEHEKTFAHYTKKATSQTLLFDKESDKNNPFRLYSVSTANDTQEGKTLFNYLFDNQRIPPQAEQFGAFVGCFMFNHDNLNQFRLYGKEDQTEGTGISIVVKQNFFSICSKMPFKQTDKSIFRDDDKEPLFRCIYIDPETSQVVSVGHRDFHTFYKIKRILYNSDYTELLIKTKTKEVEKYKNKIDQKTAEITKYLQELKGMIKNNELDCTIVCNLLLNLRYLVKHVAFKEEQECRIIKIKRLCEATNNIIDERHERLYINYLPLTGCVKKIYFGPKATGMELFQNLLIYHDFKDVVCYRSTSPLA